MPIWRAEYLRDDTYKHLVALITADLIAALPTILLNALVIFAVVTRRLLRNNSTILLACLAGVDLLTGLVALPFAFLVDLKRLLGAGPFCSLEKAFIVTVTMVGYASISHLVVISIDRYTTIKYPLRYEVIVTERRIIIGIILSWGFTLFMTIHEFVLVVLHSGRIYSVYSRVNVILPIVIVVGLTVTFTEKHDDKLDASKPNNCLKKKSKESRKTERQPLLWQSF